MLNFPNLMARLPLSYLITSFFRQVFISDLRLPRQACLLSQPASVNIVVNITLATCAFVTAILLFRFRWHMRLVLHEVLRGDGQARLLRLRDNHFDYDVFVSYASDNLPWVRRHLMPQLEEGLGLRLCLHQRDFIPGNNIADNIVESVQCSKKILMLFSKAFKRSQWCQFELAFCLRHVMDYDDVLIVVCLDDITSCEMTSSMMAVLKTTTYIQWWGENADAVRSFWGRLRLSLHEVLGQRDQRV
jgi:toll-like receptor 13